MVCYPSAETESCISNTTKITQERVDVPACTERECKAHYNMRQRTMFENGEFLKFSSFSLSLSQQRENAKNLCFIAFRVDCTSVLSHMALKCIEKDAEGTNSGKRAEIDSFHRQGEYFVAHRLAII